MTTVGLNHILAAASHGISWEPPRTNTRPMYQQVETMFVRKPWSRFDPSKRRAPPQARPKTGAARTTVHGCNAPGGVVRVLLYVTPTRMRPLRILDPKCIGPLVSVDDKEGPAMRPTQARVAWGTAIALSEPGLSLIVHATPAL
ncbi:hypothetical protein FRC09_013537 [Ceratobasidium sp. 395]|nr:hypothetical protein FRC09_013537 [Ceratobasidium sp. 395]